MTSTTTPHIPCAVDRPMNDHGALTLSEVMGSRTYPVVEYASRGVRETLAVAGHGTTVRVQLEPLNSRGDAWRAVDIDGGVDGTRNLDVVTQSPNP